MTVSRASFLKVCGLALLGAGVDARPLEEFVQAGAFDPHAVARPLSVQDATAQLFRQFLGSTFHVRASAGASAQLRLAEVTERPATRQVEQFSLIFHAPPGCDVPDGLHGFGHQALGAFDLFIVPVGATSPRRTVYQACFSRLRT